MRMPTRNFQSDLVMISSQKGDGVFENRNNVGYEIIINAAK